MKNPAGPSTQTDAFSGAQPWMLEIFNNSPDALLVLDLEGTILAANRAMQRITGIVESGVLGRKFIDLLPSARRTQWQHDLAMLTAGKWDVIEGCLVRDGHERLITLEVTFLGRCDFEGRRVNILHLRDISLYHNVEKALMASQEEWALSFDAITDCMCILDSEGRILRANRAMQERFHPAVSGELAGRHYLELMPPTAESQHPTLPHPISDAPFAMDRVAFKNLQGWFSACAYPLEEQPGRRTGAVMILRDITAQLETENTLKKTEAGLRQAAKMEAIGRLAGGIAHDFNNMLTSVLGYSSMLIKSIPPKSTMHDDVREIVKAAERATALTRQLLNFSHERAIETQPLNLNSIIHNLTNFIRRTIGDHIELATRFGEELGNINADVSRIEQIIINMAINARDAMPQGGKLLIETGNFQADRRFCQANPGIQPANYVLLEISDTGCGMPPHVLEHVFEPFFTTKERGKGTGLGLTTIYGIVKQFGGFIQCYSEVGKGTAFKMYLPQVNKPQMPSAAETALAELPHGNETVLVVDDELNIVTMIKQILTELGYRVLCAASSDEALDISRQYEDAIDLVLTDIIMPRMHGLELVEMLRRGRPHIKALYMSGYPDQATRQIGELPDGKIFLQKPFSFDTMAKHMRKALDAPV